MENKKINLEKKIVIAEAFLVAGILAYLFISNSPTAISPIAGQVVSDPDFVFEIENGDQILISTDVDFTNSIIAEEGSEITLPPGTYYWKVKNWLKESKVQSFTIQGHVGLNLREGEEKNLLENSGTVDLDVTKKKGGITTGISLETEQSTEVAKDNSSYEGKQK